MREAIQLSPNDAGLHHVWGWRWFAPRSKRKASRAFGRAAELQPDRVRYVYVYAVGLDSIGKHGEAIVALKGALDSHPGNSEILTALVNFAQAQGDLTSALDYAQRLAKANPADRNVKQVIEALTKQVMQKQDAQ